MAKKKKRKKFTLNMSDYKHFCWHSTRKQQAFGASQSKTVIWLRSMRYQSFSLKIQVALSCVAFIPHSGKCWAKVIAEIARQTDYKILFFPVNSSEFLSMWVIWWPLLNLPPLRGCGAGCTTAYCQRILTLYTVLGLPHIYACRVVI